MQPFQWAPRRSVYSGSGSGETPPIPHVPIMQQADAGGISAAEMDVLTAIQAKSVSFLTMPFVAGTDALIMRPAEKRGYLLIANQSAANTILIGFGAAPGATGLVPLNGLLLNPGGAYEPASVPTNEIWVIASAANTPVYLIFSQL